MMNTTFREQSIAIERKTCTHVQLTIITGKERYIRTENVCEKNILSCGPEATDTEGKKVTLLLHEKGHVQGKTWSSTKEKSVNLAAGLQQQTHEKKQPGQTETQSARDHEEKNSLKLDTRCHQCSEHFFLNYLKFSSLSHLLPVTALCFRFLTRYRTWASSAVPVRSCGPLANTHIPKSPPLGMPCSNTSQASSVMRNLSSSNYNGYLIQSLPFNSCRIKIAFNSSRINNYGLLRCHGRIGADGVSH